MISPISGVPSSVDSAPPVRLFPHRATTKLRFSSSTMVGKSTDIDNSPCPISGDFSAPSFVRSGLRIWIRGRAEARLSPCQTMFNGPFVITDGHRYEVPEGSKRLVAFVSMHDGRLERRYVAGSLWPCVDDIRAAGNLRSALWRLRGAGVDIIDADKWSLRLLDDVDVDLNESGQWAERIIRNTARHEDFEGIADRARALDVLPGCYDDWVIANANGYANEPRTRSRR